MYPKRLFKKPFRLLPHGHPSWVAAELGGIKPYVRQTGDQWRPPWHISSRCLLDFLLVYIAQGTGVCTVGDETFDVGNGDLVWIPPGTPHEMRGRSRTMHCVFAHFDVAYDPARSHWDAHVPGGVHDLSAYAKLMHPPVDHLAVGGWRGRMQLANHGAIGELLARICLEHHRDKSTSALSLSGMMMQVFAEIHKGRSAGAHVSESIRWQEMQESLRAIQDQAGEPLDIRARAARLRLSESHFRKLFRETHGMSARQVHREARVRRAREYLMYTQLTVSEIAGKLGFSSVHSLSRAFKALTGISPRQYRGGG
ncbi:MAG: helix-turn-helix domain-containing protein [Chitinivibrionales bacterium]|nr:helix-turn-helix domain-containing protein [Chitinivibrionales bacterium]MBD3395033.1 helix-turn-helix domain-containing protein [Chitinivibrionales bacterium]